MLSSIYNLQRYKGEYQYEQLCGLNHAKSISLSFKNTQYFFMLVLVDTHTSSCIQKQQQQAGVRTVKLYYVGIPHFMGLEN